MCERAARYWESKQHKAPTSTSSSLEKIEEVLREHGVIVATPTAGARLAPNVASQRAILDDVLHWGADAVLAQQSK